MLLSVRVFFGPRDPLVSESVSWHRPGISVLCSTTIQNGVQYLEHSHLVHRTFEESSAIKAHPEIHGERSILIEGCDLLVAPDEVRPGVDIRVESGRVVSIADSGREPAPTGGDVLDAAGLLAMPGLVNAHTHSPENCLRGVGEGLQLEPWLLRMFGTSGVFSPDDHYVCALAGATEMLLLGITSVVDHLWMTPPNADSIGGAVRAYEDSGIRAAIAPLVNDFDHTGDLAKAIGFDLGPALMSEQVRFPDTREALDLSAEAISRWHGTQQGRIRILTGPGGVQWCSDDLLGGLAEISRANDTGLHIHLHETDQQQAVSRERFGRSGISALDDLGVLGPGCSLPHSVWITRSDIELIGESGSTVVHNPAANLRLGSGRCPVGPLLAGGVNVAIGTDGSASSDNQSLWEMIKLAALIHNDGSRWVSGADALTMATSAGSGVIAPPSDRSAVATGGRIVEGSAADVILLDQVSDGLAGAQELAPSLALSESGRSVRHVVVDGRLVVQDGRCLTVDATAVREALREQVVKRRPGVRNPPARTEEAVARMKSFNKSLRQSAAFLSNKRGEVSDVQS